jgi:hypothetical protein
MGHSQGAELARLVPAFPGGIFEFEEEAQRWAWVVQVALVS